MQLSDDMVAASGWCAPTDVTDDSFPRVDLPDAVMSRGGIRFPAPGSPEWKRMESDRRAEEAVRAMIERAVGDIVKAQHAVLEAALIAADDEWDIHVYSPRSDHMPAVYRRHNVYIPYRFIGVSLEPKARRMTMVHWHHNHDSGPYSWDDDDDWSAGDPHRL